VFCIEIITFFPILFLKPHQVVTKNFDAAVWDSSAYSIVVEGNRHKFSQHENLLKFLLSTGNKVLVEASPSDAIWGIGLPQDSNEAMNPFRWRGTNLLGFVLMEVRDSLK